jgi:uncharacterized protein YcbK (DUF882 family)
MMDLERLNSACSQVSRRLPEDTPSRRSVLIGLCTAAVAAATPRLAGAAASRDMLYLSLRHAHTGEAIQIVYYKDGRYDQTALARPDWFMRDWREGIPVKMDRKLYWMLSVLQYMGDWRQPMTLLSGYRSEKTNRMLRERGGAALRSYHLRGMAADFHVQGVRMEALRDVALILGQGGVGWYPNSDFVHIDTGPVRRW